MPSTYTLNNGIELIGTGEQSGTWGDTTNTNLSLIDVALDGQVTVTLASAGTSGSPNTLPISDGATSDGRNRMVIFADGGDLGATAYVQLTPNDAEKIIYVRNDLSGSRSILLFQGTYSASNDYEVPAGTTAVVYFDGAGSGAVAANVFNNAYFDGLRLGGVSVTAILDEDDMSSDSATALATQQSIKAYVDSQVGTVDTLSEILANGNTTGGNDILFGDNDKAIFGAGSDLQIYHSGAESFIDDAGTGNFYIRSNKLYIQKYTGETMAVFTSDGAVDLRYDDSQKLATTATGVDITGTAVTDGLTVAGNVSVDGGTIKLDGNYPVGTGNVALGDGALDDGSLSGSSNTALGAGALSANTTGSNTAVGRNSLSANTTGSTNTAIGQQALTANKTGSSNTALGRDALLSNTTGAGNVAVGYQSGSLVGDEIVATAIVSGVNYTIQTLGTTDFTLIGAASNTVGTTFTATGAGTGTGTASANANYNTFVGYQAGDLIVGGSKNSILGGFDGNQGGLDIRNSDNNIVLSDGDGNPRMRIDSSGNVGIGTSSPATKLDVNGSVFIRGNSILGLYNTDSTNQYQIYNGGSSGTNIGQLVFTQGGVSERMRIDSSGNVGIGTASPNSYTGYTALTLNNATNGGLIDVESNGTRVSTFFGTASQTNFGTVTATPLVLLTNNTERMRIDSSGNVGIGDTAPYAWSSVQPSLNLRGTSASFPTRSGALIFKSQAGTHMTVMDFQTSNDLSWNQSSDSGSSWSERMRLDSSGNLLVNTSSGSSPFTLQTRSGEFYQTGMQINSTNSDFSGALLDMRATSGSVNTVNGRFLRFYSDNGSTERFHVTGGGTVYAAGSVGIGTSSPEGQLHLYGDSVGAPSADADDLVIEKTGDTGLSILSTTTGRIYFGDAASNDQGSIRYVHSDNSMRFETDSAEAMRIDSNGNLLVGTTDDVAHVTSASGEGIALSAGSYGGFIGVSRNSDIAVALNRQTDDGDILQFRKDGGVVGTIASENGYTKIVSGNGTAGSGLGFYNYKVSPVNPNGNVSDNAVDLGDSDQRFKDLYLSGGVVFGATGGSVTSKTLDDYEEGTWTPSFGGSSSNPTVSYTTQRGTYVKTGNMVIAHFNLQWNAWSADGSGYTVIYGLPFTSKSSASWYTGSISETGNGLVWGSGYTQVAVEVVNGGTTMAVTKMGSQLDQAVFNPTVAIWSSNDYLNGVIMYPT